MTETAAVKTKKFNPLALVVLVLVILVVGGAVWYRHDHKTSNKQVVSSVPAGWSRYANTKYGFEFIYPNDWGTPNFSASAADKGKSYAINFDNSKLTSAQQAKQPSVSIIFDSQDMSLHSCAVNDPSVCDTQTAFTSSQIKKLLSSSKSLLTTYDNDSATIVVTGPTDTSETMRTQQIVNLTTANASAVILSYTIQNAATNCPVGKFAPDSQTGCITNSDYTTVKNVLNNLQNI